MKTINQAKLEFWAQLDDTARSDWLAFYSDCQELLGGRFDLEPKGTAVEPFRLNGRELK